VVAGESRTEARQRVHDLIDRQEKCEAMGRVASERGEGQQACAGQAAALRSALTALEIQSQQDLDEAQARLAQAAPADRAPLERARDDAAKSMNWARAERLQREQLETARVMEAGCERQARYTAGFIQREAARPSQASDSGAARAFRDRAWKILEQQHQKYLACAATARTQQAHIRSALRGGTTASGVAGAGGGRGDRAAFQREVQALQRGLQQVAAQLDDRKALRYEDFTTRMAALNRELAAFRARHTAFLADTQGQPLVGKLIEAAALAIRSADTWRRAAGVQDVAQRDTILREVSVQWQAFQKLVRETSELAVSER
jgi:hypothetical protein